MLVKYIVIVLATGGTLITNSKTQKLAEQKIQSYATCKTDGDCKINSFCFGNDDTVTGKCKCLDGYELNRNITFYECLPGAKLADACEKDFQCQVTAGTLAVCNRYKLCECNGESHNYNGKCFLKVKIGDICMTDGNCYLDNGTPNGDVGYCVDGRCSCRADQKPSEDRTKCLTSRKLGETCIADEECSSTTPNTRCLETCKCATEYAMSRNESTCIKAATKFDEPCDFDAQCSKFLIESTCNNGKCGCEVGFHGYGIRCVASRKAGERCEEDAQCLFEKKLYENVKCQEGTCRCLYGNNADGSCKIEKVVDDNSASSIEFVHVITIVTILAFLVI